MSEVPALRTLAGVAILSALLAGCTSADKPKPVELPPNAALVEVRQAWAVHVPAIAFPLQAVVNGDIVTIAATDGTVVAIDAVSGTERSRGQAGAPLLAGVGSDGSVAAVVTVDNDLVALQNGKVRWKQRLAAQAYTAPLVAGRRVFVLAADRTISAWDGQTGRRLWAQARPSDNLVLRKPGVLLAVGDTLVAGEGGRLVGLNPANGAVRWESPIASARGVNDVERLLELTGSASRVGENVCARVYPAAIGCVDASRGALAWSRPALGSEGLGGDERFVYGTEANGDVVAWNRGSGERAWVSPRLRNRTLTAPLALGRVLVIGESTGTLHFVSREDGALMSRVTSDGSAIAAAPVLARNTVVVVTRNGGVFGYRPG